MYVQGSVLQALEQSTASSGTNYAVIDLIMDSIKYGLAGVLAELTSQLSSFAAYSNTLQTLLSPQRVSLEELFGILQRKDYGRLPSGERGVADCLVRARIVQECLKSPAVTSEEARTYIESTQALAQAVPTYDPWLDDKFYLVNVAASLLQCQTVEEVMMLYSHMEDLNRFRTLQDFSQLHKTLGQKYVLFQSTGSLTEQLQAAVEMDELPLDVEKAAYKRTLAEVSLVYLNSRRYPNIQELVGYLKCLSIEDQALTQAIDSLAEREGYIIPRRAMGHGDSAGESTDCREFSREEIKWCEQLHKVDHGSMKIKVHRARVRIGQAQTEVAVKEYTLKVEEAKKGVMDELKILQKLSGKGECFVEVYGYYLSRKNNYEVIGIVMEDCPLDLSKLIKKRQEEERPFDHQLLQTIYRSLLEAFVQLESHQIYHKDIKPMNILISKDNVLKITDFNISKVFDSTNNTLHSQTTNVQGTRNYMAPELRLAIEQRELRGDTARTLKYNYAKADAFSLGLVFLELATFQPIFHLNRPENTTTLKEKIQGVSNPTLRTILSSLLEWDPKQRCTIRGALALLDTDDTIRDH